MTTLVILISFANIFYAYACYHGHNKKFKMKSVANASFLMSCIFWCEVMNNQILNPQTPDLITRWSNFNSCLWFSHYKWTNIQNLCFCACETFNFLHLNFSKRIGKKLKLLQFKELFWWRKFISITNCAKFRSHNFQKVVIFHEKIRMKTVLKNYI